MSEKLTINSQLLDKCIGAGLNIMFHGKHGVGKTHMVLDAFQRNNLHFKYFSAATMDPWIDFIGVPREMQDENGAYLELVRPKEFRDDKVEAIFLDEFNRAPKKIRNAVMELIQFKSINGHKFPNLKIIWTAVNPDDGSYDTEGMDDAQKDRFQVHIEVPYKPDPKYFAQKYGADMAEAAIAWWKALSPEVQAKVSPRRLDTALECFNMGIELRGMVLPKSSNVQKLVEDLSKGPAERRFNQLLASKKRQPMKEFLEEENNFADCEKIIAGSNDNIQFCLGLLVPEKQMTMLAKYSKVEDFVFANPGFFWELIERVGEHGQNAGLKNKAQKVLSMKGSISTKPDIADPFSDAKRGTDGLDFKTLENITYSKDFSPVGTIVKHNSRQITTIKAEVVLGANSTTQRIPIIEQDIAQSVSVNMGKGDAIYALQVIDYIISRSQSSTILSINNFTQIINTIITALSNSSNDGMSIGDIAKIAPFLMTKIVPLMLADRRISSKNFIFAK